VVVPEIAKALLEQDSGEKAALRLRLATSLYNMLPARTPVQFEVCAACGCETVAAHKLACAARAMHRTFCVSGCWCDLSSTIILGRA
jgi:hypothetical protein